MSDPAYELVKKKAERKMFVIRKAISFARANLDEMNEALFPLSEDTVYEPITDDEMDEVQLLVEQDDLIPVVGFDELAEAEKEIREAQKLADEKLRPEDKDAE